MIPHKHSKLKGSVYREDNIGEQKIKADMILNAWVNYCRESRLYRVMEYIGLR